MSAASDQRRPGTPGWRGVLHGGLLRRSPVAVVGAGQTTTTEPVAEPEISLAVGHGTGKLFLTQHTSSGDLLLARHPLGSSAADVTPPVKPTVTVRAVGELDLDTADGLRSLLLRALSRHEDVRCDMSGVTFMDCSGVDMLSAVHRRAVLVGVDFVVVRPSPAVRRLLAMTSLDAQVRVQD